MPGRRVLSSLIDQVPVGAELVDLAALLGDDLVGNDDLRDLVGGQHVDAKRFFEVRAQVPRVRPILVALAARAAGASRVDRELQYAAELLHVALAVHDLALGREGGRRRRLARRLVKRSVSFLGGNHLTLRALELTRQGPPEVLGELVDTLREFSDGQALLRELQRGGLPTEDDWLEHADAHTGALFAFCCRSGGHLGLAQVGVTSALGRYGRHMGRLWNVAEDCSALTHGDAGAHLLGRAVAGRPVLPVILAAEVDEGVPAAWSALVNAPDESAASALASRVEVAGGVARAREVMARESWAARRALRQVPASRYREGMDLLAKSIARTR